MASIIKQRYTAYPNGKKVTKKSKHWYVDYKDADGIRRRVKGFKDKAAGKAAWYYYSILILALLLIYLWVTKILDLPFFGQQLA